MAAAAATATPDEAGPAPKKGPSLVIQFGLLVVMTGVALGIGWFSGGMLDPGVKPAGDAAAHAPAAGGHGESGSHGEAAKEGGHDEAAKSPTLVDLPPMTTNLAAPAETWMRLELTLVFDTPQSETMVATIHQDLVTYIRTIRLHQLDGASGFRHFHGDLEERAMLRSDGHLKNLLIRTMLVE